MDQPLEVRLLGPLEVVAHGTPGDIGGARRGAVLAMLALHGGRVVPIETLMDGLWGDRLPTSPRNAIHHHVARLRAALGEAAIVGTPQGYALGDAWVDAFAFEELLTQTRQALQDGDLRSAADAVERALALWRGAPLPSLRGTEWFDAEARRLEALHVDLLEEKFEVALALGEHRDLAPALRSALEDNPFRERMWAQLMLALYRSGRQADALEAFRDARRVLDEELGVEPGPDLRRLHEAILGQDPSIDVAALVPVRAGNLPACATSFVGRADEIGRVAAALRDHRFVTLVGPPGVGKSRLALEVAHRLDGHYPDGAWLADLARSDGGVDPAGVLAHALGVRGSPPLGRVISRFRYSTALVVLDTCERAGDGAARLVSDLLAECPQLRVLAASREALGLPGEVRVVVPPLGPEGAQLLLDRAAAARPGASRDALDLAIAERIVRRLDGLPLAIELAAARASTLNLGEILSVLERRGSLLDDLPPLDPARVSLHALLEWSYDTLREEEQSVLHMLAVHRGGASLPSLAAMGAHRGIGETRTASILGTLVGKSVVSASFTGGATRYDVLDSVREHILGRLAAGGDLAAVRTAHAEFFAGMAGSARTGLRGPDWSEWMERLGPEHDNLWAALAHAEHEALPFTAASLGTGTVLYFGIAGRVAEGRAFIERALSTADGAPSSIRAELLADLSYLATEDDDLDAAIEYGERGLALAAEGSAPWERALTQMVLSFAHDRAGTYERAVALAGEARRSFGRLGDEWGVATAALFGALGALGAGDTSGAGVLTAEAARLFDHYDVGAVPAALVAGSLAERRGDAEAAQAAYRLALERSESAGFADHAAFALTGLGSVASAQGRLEEAERHLRRALAVATAASAQWLVAHATVRLAHVLEAQGDRDGATGLYREVIAWSEGPRRREAREALFIALAGSPVSAALLSLAGLSDPGEPTTRQHIGGATDLTRD